MTNGQSKDGKGHSKAGLAFQAPVTAQAVAERWQCAVSDYEAARRAHDDLSASAAYSAREVARDAQHTAEARLIGTPAPDLVALLDKALIGGRALDDIYTPDDAEGWTQAEDYGSGKEAYCFRVLVEDLVSVIDGNIPASELVKEIRGAAGDIVQFEEGVAFDPANPAHVPWAIAQDDIAPGLFLALYLDAINLRRAQPRPGERPARWVEVPAPSTALFPAAQWVDLWLAAGGTLCRGAEAGSYLLGKDAPASLQQHALEIASDPELRLVDSSDIFDEIGRRLDASSERVLYRPDTALLALAPVFERRWAEERAFFSGPRPHSDEDIDKVCDNTGEVVDQIAELKATTLEGFRLKARAIMWCYSSRESLLDPDRGFLAGDVSPGPSTATRLATGLINDLLGDDGDAPSVADIEHTLAAQTRPGEA